MHAIGPTPCKPSNVRNDDCFLNCNDFIHVSDNVNLNNDANNIAISTNKCFTCICSVKRHHRCYTIAVSQCNMTSSIHHKQQLKYHILAHNIIYTVSLSLQLKENGDKNSATVLTVTYITITHHLINNKRSYYSI